MSFVRDKQVAASASSPMNHPQHSGQLELCESSENIIGDIIAQQKEFMLRQATRSPFGASNVAVAGGSSTYLSNASHAPTNAQQRSSQKDKIFTGSQTALQQDQPAARSKHGRKFSLSLVMNQFAPFSTGASTVGHLDRAASGAGSANETDASAHLSPSAQNKAPIRPARRMSRLNSADSTGAQYQVPGLCSASMQQGHFASGASTAIEKKRGLVHKAIRRGSKIFDSMLLSSVRRHSQTLDESGRNNDNESEDAKTAGKEVSSQEDELDEPQLGTPRAQSRASNKSASQRVVQFRESRLDSQRSESISGGNEASDSRVLERRSSSSQSQNNDEQTCRRRRRKLRLGSIPHDLRRAFSFGGAHHHQTSQQQQQQQQHKRPPSGHVKKQSSSDDEPELSSGEQLRARLNSLVPGQLLSACNETKSSSGRLALDLNANGSSKNNGQLSNADNQPPPHHHHHPEQSNAAMVSGVRFKRKNSLFAPLSSAASSASSALFGLSNQAGKLHHHLNQQQHQQQQQQERPEKQSQAQQQQPQQQQASASSQSASFTLCQDHNRTYKLIIFGSSAVGKTSLIQRFLYGHFPATHKPTVEELHTNKYNIPEMGEIYLEILDTSGTFEFPAMRRLSIEKGDAFILVFSVADESSWQEVCHLRNMILEEKGDGSGSAERRPSDVSGSTDKERDATEAVSSIYAAATRLAAANRRTSSSSSLGNKSAGATSVMRRQSIQQQLPLNATSRTESLVASVEKHAAVSSQYSNSQLSRLLSKKAKGAGGHQYSASDSDESDQEADQRPPPQQQRQQKESAQSDEGTAADAPVLRPLFAKTPIVVVANKCDLDTSAHQVDADKAERLVRDEWGNSFVKCSAKEALNIDRVFKELLIQARAPEILSQFVIDDHQQRRQSLPALKNQLSALHVRGLRNMYNQQQQQQQQQHKQLASQPHLGTCPAPATQRSDSPLVQPSQQQQMSGEENLQCAIM